MLVVATLLGAAAPVDAGGVIEAELGDALDQLRSHTNTSALATMYRERLEPWAGLVCWQGTCAYGPVDTVLSQLALAVGDTLAVFARELDVA